MAGREAFSLLGLSSGGKVEALEVPSITKDETAKQLSQCAPTEAFERIAPEEGFAGPKLESAYLDLLMNGI